MLSAARNGVVNMSGSLLDVRIRTVENVDSHGHGANIETLLLNHGNGLENIMLCIHTNTGL